MNIQEIYEELQKNMKDSIIKMEEDMSKHTSFKVGGKADIFIKIATIDELKYILQYTKKNNIPLTVIGNGSNILVKDNGIRGITIKLEFNEIEIEENENEALINVGAGVKLGMLASILLKKEIAGFEFASRNSRNYRWSYSYECWSLWKRNERDCKRSYCSAGYGTQTSGFRSRRRSCK